MARRSQRLSSASQATSPASHKRAASTTAAAAGAKVKRAKAAKVTPTKSQYFEKTKGPEASASGSDDIATSSEDEEASEFGDESKEASSSDGGDDDYDQDSDNDPKSRKKAKPKNAQTSSPAIRTKDGELWREGVKTGLGPGTQVIIKKPKARPAGSTPYRDETIHPNTLLFLKDLKANNERQWLKSKFMIPCATLCSLVVVSWWKRRDLSSFTHHLRVQSKWLCHLRARATYSLPLVGTWVWLFGSCHAHP